MIVGNTVSQALLLCVKVNELCNRAPSSVTDAVRIRHIIYWACVGGVLFLMQCHQKLWCSCSIRLCGCRMLSKSRSSHASVYHKLMFLDSVISLAPHMFCQSPQGISYTHWFSTGIFSLGFPLSALIVVWGLQTVLMSCAYSILAILSVLRAKTTAMQHRKHPVKFKIIFNPWKHTKKYTYVCTYIHIHAVVSCYFWILTASNGFCFPTYWQSLCVFFRRMMFL